MSRAISAARRLETSDRILLEGDVDPAALFGRLGVEERHVAAGLGEPVVLLPGDLLQLILGGRERALVGDHGGGRGVARRLGVLDVGDGDEADVESRRRLIELAGYGLEGRLIGVERVVGGEHVEVGLCDPQDQLLLGGLIGGLGLRDLGAGRLERHPVRPREHVLPEVETPGPGRRVDARGDRLDHHRVVRARQEDGLRAVVVVAGHGRGAVELWQERGDRLRARLARRQAIGVRLADHGIALQRVLEYPDQILRLRAAGEAGEEAGECCGTLHGGDSFRHGFRSARLQKLKRAGRGAFTSGSITVSKRLSLAQAVSLMRRTRRASITGASPTTTNRRPPTASERSKRPS